MTARNDRQLVLRAPADLVVRAEKLRDQAKRLGFPVSISEIYRQALERGLSVLERRARRR